MGTFQRIVPLQTQSRLMNRRTHLPIRKNILPYNATSTPPPSHTEIHILCKLINAVVPSAQEAKFSAGFITTKELVPIHQALE